MRTRFQDLHAPVADFLSRVSLAPHQSYKSLAIWPLVLRSDAPPCTAPPFVALADAAEAGALRVDEVGPGGTVPHVRVENDGDTAVLVLFGEELRGAKQNRVANASFLVGPHSHVVIDVSCVEQGRWARRPGAQFSASREVLSNSLRKKMALKVAEARAIRGAFAADQSEVWEEVSARLCTARTDSHTGAYADYLDTRRSDLREFASAFHPVPGQVGFVAAIGDTVAGVEIVGRPEVFARTFDGLVRAYGIDAVDAAIVRDRETVRAGARRFDAPEPFLHALAAAPGRAGASLGLGEDVRLDDGHVAGCALVAGDVVHLTAFPCQSV